MSIRLILAASLALTLGACESFGGFGNNDSVGSTSMEPGLYGNDEGIASNDGLGDDCYMRRVGTDGVANSLVCQ